MLQGKKRRKRKKGGEEEEDEENYKNRGKRGRKNFFPLFF